jgi:hypothetical protein
MTRGIAFKVRFVPAVSLLMVVVLSLSVAEAQEPPAKWTFMVYMDADNNLEVDAIEDFLEMAQVGSNEDIDIVVLFDRIEGYDSSYEDWTSANLFHIEQNELPVPGEGVSWGEVNMGDPETLVQFVTSAAADYPADNYALVLWNHGGGWRSRAQQEEGTTSFKDVCWDDTSWDVLYTYEVRQALEEIQTTVGTIDLIGFDACLMAMIEVAYELRNYGEVMVGSEELEPVAGWAYDDVLADLAADPLMTPAQLGQVIVDRYYEEMQWLGGYTQSAIDLGEIEELANRVDTLAATLIDHWDDDQDAVKSAATNVMTQVELAVIHERHGNSWPGSNGLAIYFPEGQSVFDPSYTGTSILFALDTQWEQFLSAFYDTMRISWVKTARVLAEYFECEYLEHIDLYDFCYQLVNHTPPSVEYEESLVTNEFIGAGDAQGWKGDDQSWLYSLPFSFPFFGEDRTTVWVCSNGYLDFQSSAPEFFNWSRTFVDRTRIAPLWTDLDTTAGDIYIHQPTADCVCIRWDAVEYGDFGAVNVEVVLQNDGTIKFNYGSGNTTVGAGWPPTAGISNGDRVNLYYSQYDGIPALTNAQTEVWTPVSGPEDSDGDGLLDSVETDTGVYVDENDTGTDPDNPDTDGDGLTDGDEVHTYPCDPNDADTDDDDLEDGEEIDTHGTDPVDDDSDNDSYTDGEEVAAGTDPLDAASMPSGRPPPAPPAPAPARGHHSDSGIEKLNPCFIATAAYGTPTTDQVRTLLEFRDRYLLTSRAGCALVRAYYRLSPPVARFIGGRPVGRRLVRAALAPVVLVARAAVDSPVACTAALASAVALLLSLTAFSVSRGRRRQRIQPSLRTAPLSTPIGGSR